MMLECPCYICLVSVCCPGRYPTPEEWEKIEEESADWAEMCESMDNNLDMNFDDLEIPELEAQLECPYFQEWENKNNEGEENKEWKEVLNF